MDHAPPLPPRPHRDEYDYGPQTGAMNTGGMPQGNYDAGYSAGQDTYGGYATGRGGVGKEL